MRRVPAVAGLGLLLCLPGCGGDEDGGESRKQTLRVGLSFPPGVDDAADRVALLAVRRGRKRPWQVKPYAAWRLRLPFGSARIGGATYDPAGGLIYVSQQFGNGTEPVIHVFKARET